MPTQLADDSLEYEEVDFDHIQTETWVLRVPSDWMEKPQENGSIYFESPNGEKGFYITTWNLGEDSFTSPSAAIESYYDTSRKSLDRMEGYSWKEVDRQSSDDTVVAQLVVDHLSADRMYLIVEKYVVRQGTLVRAAFHDYNCEDYTTSRQAFEPIISSLTFTD